MTGTPGGGEGVPLPFRVVLRFLPGSLRTEYGEEMEQDVRLRLAIARRHGGRAVVRLWFHLVRDVAAACVREGPETLAGWIRHGFGDLRMAAKNLARSPLYLVGTALVFALGIGLSTSMFSVAEAVLFRPLPYPGADRLVNVWDQLLLSSRDEAFFTPELPSEHLETLRSVDVFDGVAAYRTDRETLLGVGDPEVVTVASTERRLLDLLGARTQLGRLLDEREARETERVAVLSPRLWAERFGQDRGVLGRKIRLGPESYTVIGVLAGDFAFPDADPAVYLPLQPNAVKRVEVIGHLAAGVTPDGARLRVRTLYQARDGAAAEARSGWAAQLPLVGLRSAQVHGIREKLLALLGASLLLLLIACANGASLTLVRALNRGREFSTRAALGAGSGRLARMLVQESILLGLAGGVVGIATSVWLVRLFVWMAPDNLPRLDTIGVDRRVLLFTLGASILTGLLAGVIPLWGTSRGSLLPSLRQTRATTGQGGARLRSGLIVLEIALSVVLLAGSGLMVRTLLALHRVDLGFRSDHLLTFYLNLPVDRYPDGPARKAFMNALETALAGRGEVEAVAFSNSLPVSASRSATWLRFPEGEVPPGFTGTQTIPGFAGAPGQYTVNDASVSESYFDVFGLRLLAGRLPEHAPGEQRPYEVIISQRMAEALWGGPGAIGKRMVYGSWNGEGDSPANPIVTIVGIVADARFGDIRLDFLPTMYTTFTAASATSRVYGTVRTRVPPETLASRVRSVVEDIDPDLPVQSVRTMPRLVDHWLAEPRYYALLFNLFAASALLLTMAGVYGVVSFTVSQRTREFGIRAALGATAGGILRSVMGRGVRLVLIGSVIGLAGALAATRAIRSLLFGVAPGDPWTLAAATALIAVAALTAIALPAGRATRVDPVEALRTE